MLVEIEKIKVPERARKSFSNIDDLAESIRENGLINPPTVTPELDLIAGERRLRACKRLGYQQIEVRVMPVSDAVHHLRLERDENDKREPFTFSEAVELGRRIEEIERTRSKERMENPTENFPEGSKGETRDKVAEQVGFGSGKQYEKAKFVANNADPELIQQLDEKQISIHAAYQKLKAEKEQTEWRLKTAESNTERLRKQLSEYEVEKKRREEQSLNSNPRAKKTLEARSDRQEQHQFEVSEARKFDKVLAALFTVTGTLNDDMVHYWLQHCIGEKRSQIEAATLQVNLAIEKLQPIQAALTQLNHGPMGVNTK